MQGISVIAFAAAFAALPIISFADTQHLGSITLSASREAKELSRTGASVSVLTAEDMNNNGQGVAAQLSRLPGVSLSRSGGLGAATTLRLRGLGGEYIGVLMDGINIADPSGTKNVYDFGTLTMGGFDRIEVLRGSQSALYGSSAVGGVVNLTSWTPQGQGLQGALSLEGGSNGSFAGSGSVGYADDRSEVALSYSRTITDGISAVAAGSEEDGFTVSALTLSAARQISDDVRIGGSFYGRNAYSESDSSYPTFADSDDYERGLTRGGRLYVQWALGTVEHEFSVARSTTDRDYVPAGYHYEGRRDVLAYNGSWQGTEALSLHWGAEHQTEFMYDLSTLGEVDMTGLYGELLYAPRSDLDISLALRHDEHETFGPHRSARVALAWRPHEDWVIRGLASSGYRAPSLYELYSAYGQQSLRPETSQTYELGAEYLLAAGSLQATLFETKVDQRIDWDNNATGCASPAWGCYFQVPGETRTKGIELAANYEWADWSLYGNYTYVDAKTAQARSIRVPRHDLTLGAEGKIADRLSLNIAAQRIINTLDTANSVTSALPNHTLVHAGLRYDLTDQTALRLRVENLLDEDYQTVHGYNQPRRQVFVGLATSF